jgi:hypothetical protein
MYKDQIPDGDRNVSEEAEHTRPEGCPGRPVKFASPPHRANLGVWVEHMVLLEHLPYLYHESTIGLRDRQFDTAVPG